MMLDGLKSPWQSLVCFGIPSSLVSLKDKKKAELYMDLFCEKTGTEKRYVQGWLPIVAAAQLAYKRPEEKDLLESWINVFEYQ